VRDIEDELEYPDRKIENWLLSEPWRSSPEKEVPDGAAAFIQACHILAGYKKAKPFPKAPRQREIKK
jgi:hypothetical protein